MDREQLWNKFMMSGKIEHYLQYTNSNENNYGGGNGADKDKGIDTESIEP